MLGALVIYSGVFFNELWGIQNGRISRRAARVSGVWTGPAGTGRRRYRAV